MIVFALLACSVDKPTDTGSAAAPWCTNGAAGPVDAAGALYVANDGDDSAAGTSDAPLETLARALELAATEGSTGAALGSGSFAGTVSLTTTLATGFEISGCGADSTTLVPASEDDEDTTVLEVDSATVALSGFAIAGGRRSLKVDAAAVSMDGLEISGATLAAFFVSGASTITASDLVITAVTPESIGDIEAGYGISLSGPPNGDRLTFTLSDSSLSDLTVAGIIGEQADISLTNVQIDGVAADPIRGTFGRGVQVQSFCNVSMEGGGIKAASDAALFSVASETLTVQGVTIAESAGATIPDSSDTSGDGIVAIRGADAAAWGVSVFHVTVTDSVFTDNNRAAVLLEDVSYSLAGNTASGGREEGGTSFFAQGAAAEASAGDSVAIPATELDLNVGSLTATVE